MNIPTCLIACTLLAPCAFANTPKAPTPEDAVEKKLVAQIAAVTEAYDKRLVELKAQRDALDSAYEKKLAEISLSRIANLESLLKQAMKNGDADRVVAIKDQIDTIQRGLPSEPVKVEVSTNTVPDPKTPATLEEAVLGTWDYRWSTATGTWYINKDSTMVSHDGIKGKWRISNKKLIVEVRDPRRKSMRYEFPFTSVTQTVVESSSLTVEGKKYTPATIYKRAPGAPPRY